MKAIIITQNETMFLPAALEHFFQLKPGDVSIIGTLILNLSPFGEKKSFISKLFNTLYIFGFNFTFRYGLNYFCKKYLNKMFYLL